MAVPGKPWGSSITTNSEERKVTEGTTAFPPPYGESAAAQQSTVGVARDEAANVGQSARDAAGNVASTAVDQARNVADETRQQAADLLGQARSQVREQALVQQRKAAGNLHTLAGQLSEMASANGDSGMATRLAEEAGNRVHSAAAWLDVREPADVLNEVRAFARRRPGTFLLGAALAGVVAGRMTRGVAAAARSGETGSPQAGRYWSGYEGAGYEGAGYEGQAGVYQPAEAWTAPDPALYPAAPDPAPVADPLSVPGAGSATEYGGVSSQPVYGDEEAIDGQGGYEYYREGQP
jgi:hypothetical protein